MRAAVEERAGGALAGAGGEDPAGAVPLWWREADGDLSDALTDAFTGRTACVSFSLLTPHPGRDGYVEPAGIAESATAAGLGRPPRTRR